MSGILLAKTFGQQEESVRRFRAANAKLAALQLRGSLVGRWFFMLVGTIFSIMPAFVYWLAGVLAIQGDPNAPTAGDIVAFTTLQSRLFFPLGQLLSVQVEVQGALALFDRIFEYLDLEPEISEPEDAVVLRREDVRGRLRFRHASFAYPHASRPLAMGAAELATDTRAELDPSILDALDGADRSSGGEEDRLPDGVETAPLRPRGHRLRGRAWPARRARGPIGLGQDDDDVPRAAPLRRPRRQRRDRRRRCPADQPREPGDGHRVRDPGDVPLPRVGAREPRVREARRHRPRAPGRRSAGRHPRPHPRAARGLRHGRRASAATSSRAGRSSASRWRECS